MACIIVVGRGRRGASVVRRRGRVGVRAWRSVRLVSGGGPSGRHGSEIGGIGIFKARVGTPAVSLGIKTLDRASLLRSKAEWSSYRIRHA